VGKTKNSAEERWLFEKWGNYQIPQEIASQKKVQGTQNDRGIFRPIAKQDGRSTINP
jgi:hypothetical protein